jgi:DNA-binding GntR family transcriptional regulator
LETLLGFYNGLADEKGRKRQKLYEAVLKMIERGFWNPGDRLPTDAEFSRLLPVSVATVQAALTMLADQKVIIRKQKQGSFIASEENLQRDAVFLKFQHRENGRSEHIKFKSFAITESDEPGPGKAFFGHDQPLIKIRRISEVSDEFLVDSEIYLADPRLRILLDLDPAMLKDLAIRTLLQTRFGLPSTRFEWKISVSRFPDEICENINVPTGTIGQIVDAEVYTVKDEKLMFQRLWVPPSNWAFRISG